MWKSPNENLMVIAVMYLYISSTAVMVHLFLRFLINLIQVFWVDKIRLHSRELTQDTCTLNGIKYDLIWISLAKNGTQHDHLWWTCGLCNSTFLEWLSAIHL